MVAARWNVLQDPSTWASIGGVDEVTDVSHVGENLARFSLAATVAGNRYPGQATVTSSEPPSSMSVEITTRDLIGLIDVRIGAHLDVTLHTRSRSLLTGMMFPMIAAAIGQGLPERVDALARKLSSTS
jgi:hypothetical protein